MNPTKVWINAPDGSPTEAEIYDAGTWEKLTRIVEATISITPGQPCRGRFRVYTNAKNKAGEWSLDPEGEPETAFFVAEVLLGLFRDPDVSPGPGIQFWGRKHKAKPALPSA